MRALDEAQRPVHICDQCESPHVITYIEARAGMVELCWDCTTRFVPGWDLELHHAGYEDHVEDAYQRGLEKDKESLERFLKE